KCRNALAQTGPLHERAIGPYRRTGPCLALNATAATTTHSAPPGPRDTKKVTVMRKIYLYMTTTLDGFIAGPANELDWMADPPDKVLNDDTVALLRAADGGLLGSPVAQGMIPYWEGVAADPSASPAGRAIADAVNRLHRFIISSQPAELPWQNAELVVARADE